MLFVCFINNNGWCFTSWLFDCKPIMIAYPDLRKQHSIQNCIVLISNPYYFHFSHAIKRIRFVFLSNVLHLWCDSNEEYSFWALIFDGEKQMVGNYWNSILKRFRKAERFSLECTKGKESRVNSVELATAK